MYKRQVQLIATGAIKDLQGARDVIANSFDLLHYQPKDTEAWDAAFERFQKLLAESMKELVDPDKLQGQLSEALQATIRTVMDTYSDQITRCV